VVADITGHNPNVFYELAIAHGYQRPVVHLGQKGETLPFDIADMRTIFYDVTDLYSVRECVAKVKAAAQTALADPKALKTPLTNLDPFSAIREQAAPGSADQVIASTLQAIQTKLDRLERRIERNGDRGREKFQGLEADATALGLHARIVDQLREVGATLTDHSLPADDRKAFEEIRDKLVDQLIEVQHLILGLRPTS
jgi:hypothetical protein